MPQWRKLHIKTVESWTMNEMPDDFHRLLWLLLPLITCREGRGQFNPDWIKAKTMPLRSDITSEDVENAMNHFWSVGIIIKYIVNDRCYFVITNWHKHQGNTAKEAESIYPTPEEEQFVPYPKVSQEEVESDASTEWMQNGCRMDADAEEINTYGDEKTSPRETEKPKRKTSVKNQTRKDLEQHFSDLTGLPVPKTNTQKQRASAGTLWWGPIREMAELCEWNRERSMQLMDLTVAHLKKGGMTVSSPKSIVNTAKAVATDNVPGVKFSGNGNGTKQKIETRKIKDENTGLWVEQEVVIR